MMTRIAAAALFVFAASASAAERDPHSYAEPTKVTQKSLALDLAEPGRQGESGAAIQMSDSLGQSIAAGVVGAVFARWFLVDQGTSYLSGFGVALVLSVVALAVVGRGVRGADG